MILIEPPEGPYRRLVELLKIRDSLTDPEALMLAEMHVDDARSWLELIDSEDP